MSNMGDFPNPFGGASMGKYHNNESQEKSNKFAMQVAENQFKRDMELRKSTVLVPIEEYRALMDVIDACNRATSNRRGPKYLWRAVLKWYKLTEEGKA